MTFKRARAAGRGAGGARAAPRRPRRTLAGFLALQLLPVAAYAPARTKPARLQLHKLRAATLDPVDLPPQRRLGKLDEGIVRTARSWITEQCFRGWLRDTTKKGCLEWILLIAWRSSNRTSVTSARVCKGSAARTLLS